MSYKYIKGGYQEDGARLFIVMVIGLLTETGTQEDPSEHEEKKSFL